jgi:hypothetical protein
VSAEVPDRCMPRTTTCAAGPAVGAGLSRIGGGASMFELLPKRGAGVYKLAGALTPEASSTIQAPVEPGRRFSRSLQQTYSRISEYSGFREAISQVVEVSV